MSRNKTRNADPVVKPDEGETVSLVVRGDGVASARGQSFSRASPEAQEYLLSVESARQHRDDLEAEIGRLVASARRCGASWHAIGLSLATTGEGARRRYLYLQPDEDES
jgi:hypothetical protein